MNRRVRVAYSLHSLDVLIYRRFGCALFIISFIHSRYVAAMYVRCTQMRTEAKEVSEEPRRSRGEQRCPSTCGMRSFRPFNTTFNITFEDWIRSFTIIEIITTKVPRKIC